MSEPLMVACGGGLNSTGLLCGFVERGIKPDACLFADTGGETPEVYRHVEELSDWLDRQGLPRIITVRAKRKFATLEEECLERGQLPSIAYGFKTCSQAWKGEPQNQWINGWDLAKQAWAVGQRVVKAIGYDADEERRAKPFEDAKTVNWYPLIEWQWGRDECREAVQRHGLMVPPKSACFFCPSSKKQEIIRLAAEHPSLFDRAVAMERNAAPNNTSVKGLGRDWSWETLVRSDRAQLDLFRDALDVPCGCYDG